MHPADEIIKVLPHGTELNKNLKVLILVNATLTSPLVNVYKSFSNLTSRLVSSLASLTATSSKVSFDSCLPPEKTKELCPHELQLHMLE